MDSFVGGILLGAWTEAAALIDLTAERSTDWVSWGRTGVTGADRKASATPAISTWAALNSAQMETNDTLAAMTFWTDGTDPISATNTVNISTATLGGGFRLTAPADMEQRTLTLYLGGRRTTGRLVARLSDNSQVPLDVHIENPANWGAPEQLQRYTITYQAAQAGQTLTVDWTIQRQEDPWASISLSAASLAGGE